ncbi:peptide ABC transporter permease [Streptomyces sp. CC53]|uniref:ABC transporter permease n=1 Tax=unclassified Streptomyces TaxID=2593676 RepID=UPI0008DE830B|nr:MULTISPECIES: ABC transporter permease [unclassified Streptomyces]OII59893.1 peptide ABC transporter permease [Streptomyces sp. CC53]OII70202.1 peptide ABC transporter permease [Streptomyces sp. CC77]
MRGYALQRLTLGVAQLALLALLVFVLTSLLPGDAADVRNNEDATDAQVAALREQLGLDRPAVERFTDWAAGLATGDLGTSLVSGGPVRDVLADSVGTTLVLGAVTLALVLPLALLLGVVSGLREGGRLDRAVTSATLALNAVPDFVLALLLVAGLSLRLGLLPATWVGVEAADLLAEPALLVLPVTVVAARVVCLLSRQVRAGVVAVLGTPYVVQARRLGVPRRTLLLRHVLPNAAVPGLQELARVGDNLVGGVLIVEAVFAVPGVATALVRAVEARDVPTVQGLALVVAVAALLFSLAADLLCHRLVPRTEVLR